MPPLSIRLRGWHWIWIILLPLLALLIIFGWKPARPRLLANRALYLTNTGHYNEAMDIWAKLARNQSIPTSETFTLQQAIEHWKVNPPAWGTPDAQQALQLFDIAEARLNLATLARRGRLELLTKYNPPPSAETIQAATKILLRDGFNENALWWIAQIQYDPAKPLNVPPELRRFREQLENSTSVAAENNPSAQAHHLFLHVLVALDDRNWADAAAQLQKLQNMLRNMPASPSNMAEQLFLAQGLALLRTGRPAEAILPLESYRRTHPSDSESVAALLEAYWSLKQIPWAAASAARLRVLNPRRLESILSDLSRVLRQAQESGAARAPEMVNVARLAILSGFSSKNILNWEQLDFQLMSNGPLTIRQKLDCIELMLWRGEMTSARTLARTLNDSQNSSLSLGLEHCLAWLEQGQQPGVSVPLTTNLPNQLLSRPETIHLRVNVPAGAGLILLMLQGYPEAGVWPLVHARCGSMAASWYLAESRAKARPVLIPVTYSATASNTELSVSLLNAEEGGTRTILIGGIYFF